MSSFLNEIARSSLERVAKARSLESQDVLWQRASEAPAAPALQLSAAGFDVIAELKLRSPAAGVLRTASEDVCARVGAYAEGGASAVSVLTEPYHFDGSMAHLARASETLAPRGVPTMRKDFIIDPYQVMEARAVGAGGILVILRMLDHGRIVALLDCAAMLHMFVLMEAFDEGDLAVARQIVGERAGRREHLLVGVNARDLDTLQVVPGRLEELAAKLPEGVPHVAESGISSAEDAAQLARAGYQLVLVGSALMADDEPQALLRAMLEGGRAAAKR
ncbi:MAG TPA: indole-3-glycerol-phosphate synthase [Steroidobacteraceae bacterium]|jgi:indole-3-glycerol phosphate synthase|nr:indole-3-glycerol-phosphate synthase [Steroidobacteraceae bacterium]